MGDLLNANIVSAGYADRPKVISNVSFTVNSREIAGLIGANGAGKSTVIKDFSLPHFHTDTYKKSFSFHNNKSGPDIVMHQGGTHLEKIICAYS